MLAYMELGDGFVIQTADPARWPEGKRLTKREGIAKQRAAALKRLHSLLSPGDTVYTIIRSVARSSMSRLMDVVIARDGRIQRITCDVAHAIGHPLKNGELRMDGGGMDMGFQAVYLLGCAMWPDGTSEPHGTRNGEPDSAGGYALKHQHI